MPSDVSIDAVVAQRTEALPPRRLPIGIGLGIGACASIALWAAIGLGLRALLG